MIKIEKAKRNCKCRFCDKIILRGQNRFYDIHIYTNYYFHLNCYLKYMEKEVKERNDLINFINSNFQKKLEQEIKRRVIEEL